MAKAYKLFRVVKGELFPLYVNRNKSIPMGIWLDAEEGERLPSGKVKASLGKGLKFRPGWHLSDEPYAEHIGIKDSEGNIVAMHPNQVWCEVEYNDQISYQLEATDNGINPKTGKFSAVKADLAHIPKGGYYRYKTNPKMVGEWIIAGEMKVNRILDWDEVDRICRANGHEPQPRIKNMGFAI